MKTSTSNMNTSTSNMNRRILLAFSILFIAFGSLYAQFTMPGTLHTSESVGLPIVESKNVKGGFHQVATIAERNGINKLKREIGMLCFVLDAGSGTPKTYQLLGGIDNTNWVEFTTSSSNANLTGEVTTVGNAATVSNAAVLGKLLTGYTSGAGTIDATDNILQAIQKLNGNVTVSATTLTGNTGANTLFGNNTADPAAPVYFTAGNLPIAGDITGTLGATSVNKLQGKILSIEGIHTGDLLRYGATSWENWAPDFLKLASLSATAPLSYNNTTGAFGMAQATTTTDGYLLSADWKTFADKQSAIALTTTGTSGNATFSSNTLNIPNYTYTLPAATNGALGGVIVGDGLTVNAGTISTVNNGTVTGFSAGNLAPLFTTTAVTTTTTPALSFDLSNASANTLFGNNTASPAAPVYFTAGNLPIAGDVSGTLGTTSVNKLQGKILSIEDIHTGDLLRYGATSWENWVPDFLTPASLSATAPLSYNSTAGKFEMAQATTTTDGYLLSADWKTFADKQSAIALTATGTSGNATFSSNTLNIPNYTYTLPAATNGALGGVIVGDGLTVNAGTISTTNNGTVTGFSAGNLAPLFTTTAATTTTTPALSFDLSNASANTLFGNNTADPAAPVYFTAGDLPIAGDITGTLSASVISGINGTPVSATAPTSNQVLQYNGTSWTPATMTITPSICTKTAAYTAIATDETILVNGTATITLPVATSCSGKKYNVKNIGTGTVTVISSGGTIDGLAAATGITGSLAWQGWTFQSDGTNWWIISRI